MPLVDYRKEPKLGSNENLRMGEHVKENYLLEEGVSESVLKSTTLFFDRMVQRYLPDAFLFAVLLTVVVYISGIVFTGSSPLEMVQYWGEGFWDLLAFAMQMALIVVTGYILANAPAIKSLLSHLARQARTSGQAVVLVTVVSTVACLINYGFGLVVGALIARHVIRVVPEADYRLLVASAYSGFLVWHGGLSGSVPLTIATADHFLEDAIGIVPISETLLSGYNLFIVVMLLVTLPTVKPPVVELHRQRGKDCPFARRRVGSCSRTGYRNFGERSTDSGGPSGKQCRRFRGHRSVRSRFHRLSLCSKRVGSKH